MAEIIALKLKADEILTLALRPEQAAEALNVSLPFLQREIRRGNIKVVRKGAGRRKAVLITIAALTKYLETSESEMA